MGITSAGLLAKFARLNPAIWPMQVVAYLMVLAALFLVARKFKYSDRIVAAILAFFWIWMGIIYHMLHFSVINPAARVFGVFFRSEIQSYREIPDPGSIRRSCPSPPATRRRFDPLPIRQ